MTNRLPLYNPDADDPEAALYEEERVERSPDCKRCEASIGSPCVAAAADGAPGGLLVLGDMPTEDEARLKGRPHWGRQGRYVRRSIEAHWKGPVAYDNAVRCRPPKALTDAKMKKAVAGCRTYTAEILDAAAPERILIMGQAGLMSLFGRLKYPRVGRGYQWLRFGGREIPVFFLPSIKPTFGNKLLKRRWQEDLEWALKANPERPPWTEATTVVRTVEEARAAIADIKESRCGILDVETYGDLYRNDLTVLCVTVGRLDNDTTYTWDTRDPNAPHVRVLVEFLADPDVGKGGHNVKYDVVALENYFGCIINGKIVDTRLLHKVLDCTEQADLDACGDQVGCGGHKAEAKEHVDKAVKAIRSMRRKIKSKIDNPSYDEARAYAINELGCGEMLAHAVAMLNEQPKKFAYAFMPEDVLWRYCARDVMTTGRVWRWLYKRVCRSENADLRLVWDELVQPATRTISTIERTGMPVDVQALYDFRSFLRARETEILMQIQGMVGPYFPDGFNVKSTPQLRSLLFEHLQLPVIKKTPGGAASADKEVLNALKADHPIVPLLLEHRVVDKLQGTYGDGLAPHVKDDGRIHCSFNIVGTETGRMSCTAPNMQTIPSRGEYAKMAKNVFAAAPGKKLVQFDFSQLELRVAAMISGDPVMRAIYAEGRDYHSETAALIAPAAYGVEFEVPTDELKERDPARYQLMKDIRTAAKAVNFGLIYGMGDGALAAATKTTPKQAAAMREAVMGKLRTLDGWTRKCVRTAKSSGYVSTVWKGKSARRRYLWNIAIEGNSDYAGKMRSNAENGSYNSPIQGTASDYCLASLTAINEYLHDEGLEARIVMTVHDSIILEVPDHELRIVIPKVRALMTGWESYGVPLEVDCEIGQAWGGLVSWEKWCEQAGMEVV